MCQGKVREIEFFQGHGIVREFCEPSGKFENIGKCQGIIREFCKKKLRCNAIYLMISTSSDKLKAVF